MKIKNVTVWGMFIITLALGNTSCDDSVTTSALTIDMTQEATITAYIYAELNKQRSGPEYAPDGTRVHVAVAYSDLNPAAGPGSWMDTLYIQNGMVEATVPVSAVGTDVTFMPEVFVADQVQPFGSNRDIIKKIFTVPGLESVVRDVRPGQDRIHEITYAEEKFENFTAKVDIKFEGIAIINAVNPQPVAVPQGTEIFLYTDEWATKTTVGYDGVFSARIPENERVNVEFITRKIVQEDPQLLYKDYKYHTLTPAYPVSTPVLQRLDFGGGTLWE